MMVCFRLCIPQSLTGWRRKPKCCPTLPWGFMHEVALRGLERDWKIDASGSFTLLCLQDVMSAPRLTRPPTIMWALYYHRPVVYFHSRQQHWPSCELVTPLLTLQQDCSPVVASQRLVAFPAAPSLAEGSPGKYNVRAWCNRQVNLYCGKQLTTSLLVSTYINFP